MATLNILQLIINDLYAARREIKTVGETCNINFLSFGFLVKILPGNLWRKIKCEIFRGYTRNFFLSTDNFRMYKILVFFFFFTIATSVKPTRRKKIVKSCDDFFPMEKNETKIAKFKAFICQFHWQARDIKFS